MEVINFRIEIVLISYLGNTPEYMFMAIVPSSAIAGSTSTSSTDFRNDKVAEINLKLNGNSVHGYPMRITKILKTRVFHQHMHTHQYRNPCSFFHLGNMHAVA